MNKDYLGGCKDKGSGIFDTLAVQSESENSNYKI